MIRAHHFYGRLLLQTGELAAAVQPLREALRTGQEAKLAPVELARMRVHLARALWADASARPEALALVDAALPTLDAEDPQLALETRQWAQGKRPSGGG